MKTPIHDKIFKVFPQYATASEREVALKKLLDLPVGELTQEDDNEDQLSEQIV